MNGDLMMSRLPWFLSILFALLAGAGWWTALQNMNKEKIHTKQRRELVKELVSHKKISPADAPVKQSIQACLESPELKKTLERKAKKWAEEISNQVLEDYKEEELRKEEERVTERMNQMQDFFSNAANIYAENYDIEPEVAAQLHQTIESQFEKQRELYQLKLQGEITDREYGQRRRQSRREGREAVFEVLGEDRAREFGSILREERERREDEEQKE